MIYINVALSWASWSEREVPNITNKQLAQYSDFYSKALKT